jgi:hypothetical protein
VTRRSARVKAMPGQTDGQPIRRNLAAMGDMSACIGEGTPLCEALAAGAKQPSPNGSRKGQIDRFEFCRFCHFRVLTAKTSPPITRLVADEPARRAPAATTTERADVLPGNRKKHSVPKN